MKKIIVGLTGASGSIYFSRVMDLLMDFDLTIHVISTKTGSEVFEFETKNKLMDKLTLWNKGRATVLLEDNEDLFSKVASGSYRSDAMVIVPCSMSTLGEISNGITKNLLTRAADVMIKEKRPLILVPRETPLSSIHLKNMSILSDLGATVLAAMPGFYGHPQTLQDIVDFMAGKILDALKIDNEIYKRWEGKLK
ncbi:UbiX family flavin prenyltransferase [Alkalibacter mobilis]|uniref:UbiX family flavin prenyltransferase n=1 Tax=Alkalibacter mobilis TaxID=2787712 RepID=UPI0018A0C0F1|nr:UbiX family flavin prenyltransferase [Alkalibacter mobilis]